LRGLAVAVRVTVEAFRVLLDAMRVIIEAIRKIIEAVKLLVRQEECFDLRQISQFLSIL
jgi:hypothetical protein